MLDRENSTNASSESRCTGVGATTADAMRAMSSNA